MARSDTLKAGDLVETPAPFRYGSFVRRGIDGVEVLHHVTIRPTWTVEAVYEPEQVAAAELMPGTRIWLAAGDEFVPGRIGSKSVGEGRAGYWIDTQEAFRQLHPDSDLRVACAEVLGESSLFFGGRQFSGVRAHAQRRRVVELSADVRAKAHGLGGLLSSTLELLPHQVEVVGRVSADPVLRYLLSDEVGLGKTIEAGAIVRDYLTGAGDATALFVVPAALRAQWVRELDQRFGMSDFPGRVRVEPSSWLHQDSEAAPPSILIVDEAHEYVRQAASESVYERLRRLCETVPALLLLTATPVQSDDQATLRLLHLLDPLNYPSTGLSRLRDLRSRREEISNLLLLLSGGDASFVAKRAAGAVEVAVPGDGGALRLAADLRASAAAGIPDHIRAARLALRDYLSDSYRLNHRLMRTRRRDLVESGLATRRGEVDIKWDPSTAARQGAEALDDWRYRALQALDELGASVEERTRQERLLAGRFFEMAGAYALGPAAFDPVAERQLAAISSGTTATFELDRAIVSRMRREMPTHGALADGIIWRLRERLAGRVASGDRDFRMVVFGASGGLVTSVATQLDREASGFRTFGVTKTTKPREITRVLREFQTSAQPSVLICDSSGEQGLNLQFATEIVHLHVPFSVMRLEQRIGRLDRIGRNDSLFKHWFYLPTNPKYGIWSAWLRILQEGFRVFDESVADLQQVAVGLQRQALLDLFRAGTASDGMLEQIRDAISGERSELERVYSLDRLQVGDANAALRFEQAVRLDHDFGHNEQTVADWWKETARVQSVDRGAGFKLDRAVAATPLPPVVREALAAMAPLEHTYARHEAIDGESLRLVRPGHPLIDLLPDLLSDTGIGRVSGIWCHAPGWVATHGEREFLELTVVQEVPPRSLGSHRRAIGDQYLPPKTVQVRLATDLRLFMDSDVDALLGDPGHPRRPPHLELLDGPEAWRAIERRLGQSWFESTALKLGHALDAAAIGDPVLAAVLATAKATGISRVAAAIARLERHHSVVTAGSRSANRVLMGKRELELLRDAVRDAPLRIEAIQLVVISDTAP